MYRWQSLAVFAYISFRVSVPVLSLRATIQHVGEHEDDGGGISKDTTQNNQGTDVHIHTAGLPEHT